MAQMLRAILQTQRQQDSRWTSSPLPPGGKQRVACMPPRRLWRLFGPAGSRPMPNPAAARRRASKSPSQTKMDCPTGPRGTTGCTPMRLARASRCCASKSMSVGFPKRKHGGKRALRLGLEPKWREVPHWRFCCKFCRKLAIVGAAPLCCWGSQTDGTHIVFRLLSSSLETSLPSSSSPSTRKKWRICKRTSRLTG